MQTRTSQSTVHFASAFRLSALDVAQPAGDYLVDRDEEPIEGLSWLAWHTVSAFIHLPSIGTIATTQQMLRIDPAELDAVLEKDRERT